MINKAKLRGKPLDGDCKRASRTTHEYESEDDRVYCYGLYEDMSDWMILRKCRECSTFVDNAKPLKGGKVNHYCRYCGTKLPEVKK